MLKTEFNYNQARLVKIICNLCGQDNFFVLAKSSASGLPVQTCLCKNCGFIYINPRMTKEEYSRYYKYYYRHDRSTIKKSQKSGQKEAFEASKKFGRALANELKKFIKPGSILDVGSSRGGTLQGFKEIFPGLEVIGIEPSIEESNFANSQGIKTYNCLFEDYKNEEINKFSNIICVQSLNHLLDPRKFFKWSYERLEPGEHLILAVKDFRYQARRSGAVEAGAQIDHPFMFVPETLKMFVESVGFKTVYLDIDEHKSKKDLTKQRGQGMHIHHIRLVAQKSATQAKVRKDIKNKKLYIKLRLQLSPILLKLYYYIFYANKIRFIKKILNLEK